MINFHEANKIRESGRELEKLIHREFIDVKTDNDRKDICDYFLKNVRIRIPQNAYITPLHNFGGSVWRCYIGNDKYTFSVYLDMFDTMGSVHEPYFELYCSDLGDENLTRFTINDMNEMNAFLEKVLGL